MNSLLPYIGAALVLIALAVCFLLAARIDRQEDDQWES